MSKLQFAYRILYLFYAVYRGNSLISVSQYHKQHKANNIKLTVPPSDSSLSLSSKYKIPAVQTSAKIFLVALTRTRTIFVHAFTRAKVSSFFSQTAVTTTVFTRCEIVDVW
jgi:hypothetical protein